MRSPASGLAAAALACAAVLVASCGTDGKPLRELGAEIASSASSTPTVPESGAASSTSPSGAPTGPTTAATTGAFRITASTGAPKATVLVIEDLGCPACAQFEEMYGSILDTLGTDPEVAVDYLLISFLDRMYPDRYSSRAANASYCVWNTTPADDRAAVWRAFQHAAFRDQPTEGGPGLDDDRLAKIAGEAGAAAAGGCIRSGQFAGQVKATSDRVLAADDFEGTPTVLVNGEKVEVSDPRALTDAVERAKR